MPQLHNHQEACFDSLAPVPEAALAVLLINRHGIRNRRVYDPVALLLAMIVSTALVCLYNIRSELLNTGD